MHHRWPTKPCSGGGVEPPGRCVRPRRRTKPARRPADLLHHRIASERFRFASSAKLKIACLAVLQTATRRHRPAPSQPATRAASSPEEHGRLPSSLVPSDETERSTRQLARWIAVVAGIAGALLCALVPLLPVKQTTATILWPQALTDGHVTDITAPLVSGAPRPPLSPPTAAWCFRRCPSTASRPAKPGCSFGPTRTRSSSRSVTRWLR